jgi:hypothetical protein
MKPIGGIVSDAISALDFRSKAWLLRALFSSAPGIPELAGGRLSFTAITSGTLWESQLRRLEEMTQQRGLAYKFKRGESVQIFDVSLQQIKRVVFPWYNFDCGAVVTIGGTRYRFSFLEPQNAKWPEARPDEVSETVKNMLEIGSEISQGRHVGKAWKAALVGQRHTR